MKWEIRTVFAYEILLFASIFAYLDPSPAAESAQRIVLVFGLSCSVLVNVTWLVAFTLKFVRPIFDLQKALQQRLRSSSSVNFTTYAQSSLRYAATRNFAGSAIMLLSTVVNAVIGVLYLTALKDDLGNVFIVSMNVDSILNILGIASMSAIFRLRHEQDSMRSTSSMNEALLGLDFGEVSSDDGGVPSSATLANGHMAVFLRNMTGGTRTERQSHRKDTGVSTDPDTELELENSRNFFGRKGTSFWSDTSQMSFVHREDSQTSFLAGAANF
jgi:hypothetical protein